MTHARERSPTLDEFRRRQALFDNTWMLVIVLAALIVLVSWYVDLAKVDVAPILGVLGTLSLLRFIINLRAALCTSVAQSRWLAAGSHGVGICAMGVAWHLFGGLQQPMFPLLIMLPLLTSALILNFWQQQLLIALSLGLLLTGVLLSPATNSFIEERYGLGLLSPAALPAWLPRSRVAFGDVTTTPVYNVMLMGCLAVLTVSLCATAGAVVDFFGRLHERTRTLQEELDRQQRLTTLLVADAPSCEALVALGTGRILHASQRFAQTFGLSQPVAGQFLLDVVTFAYPKVVTRLLGSGGDDIQGATLQDREVILRLRTQVFDLGNQPVARLSIEPCDDLCWRGAIDAIEQPVFAIDSHGSVLFLNRSAMDLFGGGPGAHAADLFDAGPGTAHWWDIGPMQAARRVLDLNGREYLASIRRQRVAESIGELSFVHLTERARAYAVAVA